MPLRDPTHSRRNLPFLKQRIKEEVKVATENVIVYVRNRRADSWRLDSKGKAEWDYTFKDNRVQLTFSKPA